MQIVKINAVRDGYDVRECTECAISVEQLIEQLERCPKNAKVVMSFDGGYMYGSLTPNLIKVIDVETYEEQEEREKREQEEEEREMEKLEAELDEIASSIYAQNIDKEFSVNDLEENFTKIVGSKIKWYDTNIYDGADGETNNYVLSSFFKGEYKGFTLYVSVSYGDVDLLIGDIEVTWM
jgi:hypothetical protein